MLRWVRIFLQGWIGLLLLTTATGKLLDVPGFVAVIHSYQAYPALVVPAIAVLMILVEYLLGAWLLWGHHLRLAALASAGLHLGFTALAVRTLLADIPVPNCGCFGVFLARPLTWGTVQEDAVMVGLSLLLAWLAGRGREATA